MAETKTYVTCKSCGEEFRSSFAYSRESFDSADIAHASERCSACGETDTYDKVDYSQR